MAYKRISPVPVVEGGTGAVTFTQDGVLIGNTGSAILATVAGTNGQVLTGNTGSTPTFQSPAASSISITGNTGGALTGASFTFVTANSTVKFAGSGSTETVDFGQNNLILGGGTIPSITSGNANVGVGAGSTLNALTSGQLNTAIGFGSMSSCNTGQYNSAVGYNTNLVTSGSYNIVLGANAGSAYTGAESSNILLGYNTGTVGESNQLKIGNGTGTGNGQINKATINGISTKSTGAASDVMLIDTSSVVGTVAGGAVTLNTGTNSISISSDASATTVGLGTGAAAKSVTVGSTTTTSSLALKYGTADFTLASATGTVMSALDTGEITKPFQPAFLAYAASSQANATGDGTLYTVTFTTEVFDVNADFDGTSTFTAPVTGKYFFNAVVYLGDLVAANSTRLTIVATSGTQQPYYQVASNNDGGFLGMNGTFFVNMTAADTCVIKVLSGGGAKIVDVVGAAAPPYYSTFAGWLVC